MDTLSYLLGKKSGGGSTPNLQDKEIEITNNGETTITADSGYDGLGNVEVTTNVPSQKYAPRFIKFIWYTGTELDYELSNLDASNITDVTSMFSACSNITSLDLSNLNFSSTIDTWNGVFNGCSKLVSVTLPNKNFTNVTNIQNMFSYDTALQRADLSNFYGTLTFCSSTFSGCRNIQLIDVRNLVFSSLGSSSYNSFLSDVPKSCLIIVKDNTEKAWFNNKFSAYTNVKTADEYEASI